MFGESYGQELDDFIADKLQLSRAYTAEHLFENLKAGRVDYILWGYYPWYINAYTLNALDWCESLPVPVVEEGKHLTISKKSSYRSQLPAINAIITRLQLDGTLDRWRDQFMQRYRNTATAAAP